MSESNHTITVRPARVVQILGGVVAVLVVLYLIGQYSAIYLGHGRLYGFVPEFDLNEELNVPTYFSSLLLLIASVLLAVIASSKSRAPGEFKSHWTWMAVVFLLLSLDETADFHGRLSEIILPATGLSTEAWTIPAILFVIIFVLVFYRFLLHLPREYKLLFTLSGFLYVFGAAGMEVIGVSYTDFTYVFLVIIEEILEMGGIILFIYTLLKYISNFVPELVVSVAKN